MTRILSKLILSLAWLLLLTGCKSRLAPARLFESRNTEIHSSEELLNVPDYILQPNDVIGMEIYTNKGLPLLPSGETMQQSKIQETDYIINKDGFANFPILGWIKASGKTLDQLRDTLSMCYAQFFVDPYVNVFLKNRYILVFNGVKDQKAIVIPYNSSALTLLQTIAQAGGLNNARSNSIQLIRKISKQESAKIYSIDLSTSKNLPYAYIKLLPGDIIVLNDHSWKLYDFVTQLSPWLTVITTTLLIISYFKP
ncbi:MAG: polysaccharide biosynthesis/export family protein [Bacteroidales bacterium]|nr:polysaccharide biosynthesis/export family protein [Bacteroidales bacterium]